MSAGIVYLLTNEAMPGYVKIGLTRQSDVGERVRQLDNTSVPTPFECYFAAQVPDCDKLERTLHFVFGEKRARRNREFFTIAPDLAKAIIDLVADTRIEITDAEQSIDAGERREIEKLRNRREVRTFTSLNIPIGETLTFTKDATITCIVAKPRKVRFRELTTYRFGPALLGKASFPILPTPMHRGVSGSGCSFPYGLRKNEHLVPPTEPR